MIKPAVLTTWPKHLDYPIFRYNLIRFKEYFSSIWIAFSEHHRNIDLSGFVRKELSFCNFVDVIRKREDWRDDAVNSMLDKTFNEKYILFLEQDFLIRDISFFEKLFKDDNDFILYQEEKRIHPAFACVKRELVEKTSKCFAVTPPGDHFYKFFSELPQGINIDTLGVEKRKDYFHLSGLSQNYINFQYNDPLHHPNNFLYYNFKSLNLPDQHPYFQQLQQRIESRLGHSPKHAFLDLFFP